MRPYVDVWRERLRQQQHVRAERIPWDCSEPDVDDGYKLTVLTEELGEVARAILEGRGLRDELVQVAAVAVAWIEALDKSTPAAETAEAPPPTTRAER